MENSPFAVEARYTPDSNPRYQGNPLIEALPPLMSDETMVEYLSEMPPYNPSDRTLPSEERLARLGALPTFFFVFERHIHLCRSLDLFLREGYVGRAPHSAGHLALLKALYEAEKQGGRLPPLPPGGRLLTSALFGVPGIGKTVSLYRILRRYPRVIRHSDLGIIQIPYIVAETPYDGASVRAVGESLIAAISELVPEADYYHRYVVKGKTNADTLLSRAARLLAIHHCGLIVFEEIQNLANGRRKSSRQMKRAPLTPNKGDALMTLLVSASNVLRTPTLFCGTMKAKSILQSDMRSARRVIGHGATDWNIFGRGKAEQPSEWDEFVQVLWRYQYVAKPGELTDACAETLYYYSQGIPDLAVKLFVSAQVRAIVDASEQLTPELLVRVAMEEYVFVEPMLDAIRSGDPRRIAEWEDLTGMLPPTLAEKLAATQIHQSNPTASVPVSAPGTIDRLTVVAQALGAAPETAEQLAQQALDIAPDKSLAEVTAKLAQSMAPKRRVRRVSPKKEKLDLRPTYAPEDYRNVLELGGDETEMLERLQQMRAIASLDALISGQL